jgi:hypothetical protein
MSSIVYTCVNEGMRKLIEYPPRVGSLVTPADTLQTVLHTVPQGEPRTQVINDTDSFTYFYHSNGKFLVGVACRRPAGLGELPAAEVKQVRAFLTDIIKLAPADGRVVLSDATLRDMQSMLKARLEATTDAQINDIQASIARARETMEKNIEATLARGDDVARMQANSEVLAQSATVMQNNAEAVNDKMCWQRMKTTVIAGIAVFCIIAVLVMLICHANLSGCIGSDPATLPTTTTAAPGRTTMPPIIHIG